RVWRALVPVVCLVAGVGFAASARDSRGTELRAPGITSLADTVRAAQVRAHAADRQVIALQHRVDRTTTRNGGRHGGAGGTAAQRALVALQARGGLVADHGAGLTVVLDDAVQSDGEPIASDAGVDPNQLVVHQSDMQAVVNALWAGGAEAMSIAGQRIVATSALRCVGNTLLLNGELYSPPYRVSAIGPAAAMQRRLDLSPGVSLFRQAAGYYGLGYTVETQPRVSVPAFRGTTALVYAHAGR
ncbi:DUF881 domain-containing protein, partial [Jatrophihabitans endophyticus]|uniref:DUF881 domain-containing protein n=1 Tax=Jatrophihabitans endophyticus TaxID=1206085 RepID=UPI0026EAED83